MKYIKLEKIKYAGINVKVGDLVLYETVMDDGDEYFITNSYYGIIQSINSHKTTFNTVGYKFDIKTVDSKSKPCRKERFFRILKVCNSMYFDKLIQKVEENVEKKIKSLQSQIEQVKPDSEKQIRQYEELKALL